jgi:amino acid adenylation domain-containing protein
MITTSDHEAMLTRLRQGRQTGASGIPRRPPGVREIPLSYGQEQLWFVDQLAPGLATYNIAGALRLAGPLDVGALTSAVHLLLERHEALRTRLVTVDGIPQQVIDGPVRPQIPQVDLGRLAGDEREAELQRLAEEEAARPFDLGGEPLLRSRLVRMAADLHVLLVVVHHTVFDGWSFGVLCTELTALYESVVTGSAHRLPELPVQFADFAVWERRRLQGPVLDELVGYWRDTLAGAAVLQLPTDRPRPPVQTYDGGQVCRVIDAPVLGELQLLSRRHGTTLFVTLMAAFQTLLHRFSRQEDIVVGTVSANRARPELAPLIGYLVNTLAIRTDLSGDPSFDELIGRVRTGVLGAYAHQDLPFAKLVDALGVPRDPSRHPLFQVGFTVAEPVDTELQAADVSVHPYEAGGGGAKFDLLIAAVQRGDALEVQASYSTALFDPSTVERLLHSFDVLLAGIVEDPGRPVSRLPLLSDAERQQEIVEWNSTFAARPDRCLHEEFQRQAGATPGLVAAELNGRTLTYAELNARANQLAVRLRELGVGPETLVGVCMQRSLDRLVALLGILKAGGGYVPLDPDYPADRLAFIVEDAAMPVVVTDERSRSAVPVATATAVSLDRDREALSALPDADPGVPVAASNAAYVIYTSGSTGRPKGVVVEHRQAVNFALGEIEHWPLGPGDRVLQFASLNFDVSVLDIFGALLSGATLVLGTPDVLLSPPRLAELIRRAGITLMCLPPAVLALLADEPFPELRVVIAGGEKVSAGLVNSWVRPGLRFVNGYGPTETTVGATMYECRADGIDPAPIGSPLPNYRAYVLDQHLQPVPVGVAGELYVGGAGVARGYLGRPDLTAQRFVPDPFDDTPSARLYRTGDLARRLPDGALQFLGRLDDQVKIRGLRVELGEIEAVLATHPAVAQAIVVVAEDRTGQPQLVGYARSDPDGGAPTEEELRRHLAGKLPGYMVPTAIVLLTAFPLTPNGKVDRAALPAPDLTPRTDSYSPPRTLLETALVHVYESLLGHESVGIHDSFFDLGGNSLQAMQLVARLSADLAVDGDVNAIFLAPTPARLAALLCEQYGLSDGAADDLPDAPVPALPAVVGGPADDALVPLTQATGTSPLFLIHASGGTVFPYARLAEELADTFAVYGIEAPGLRDGSSPAASMADLVSRYAAAVRAVQPQGPYRLGGWSTGGLMALELARFLEDAGEVVCLLAVMDAPIPSAPTTEMSEAELAGHFVADAVRLAGPGGDPPDPETIPVDDQLAWLAGRLGADGSWTVAHEEMRRRFEVYRSNVRLTGGYRPPPLRAHVLLVGAEQSVDNAGEWTRMLAGRVRTVRVPGDHYSFLSSPGVHQLAAALRSGGLPADRPAAALDDVASAGSYLCQQAAELESLPPPRPVWTCSTVALSREGTAAVRVRVHRPTDVPATVPALLYFHGGGCVTGNRGCIDASAAQLADAIASVVVTVGCRLAPEHSFAAAVDDCYTALTWTVANARWLGIDTTRIGVAGDGAGSGRAAALALLARDRGGPALCFQYLFAPQVGDGLDTPSMTGGAECPDGPHDAAALSRAADLSGLPAAHVVAALCDPLRGEGIDYAARLARAGVSTELHLYSGAVQDSAEPVGAQVTGRMLADRIEAVRRGLGVGG